MRKNRTLKTDPSQLSASPSRLRVKGCGTQPSNPFTQFLNAKGLTRSKAKSRSLVVHPHEDMRVNFLVMTTLRFGASTRSLPKASGGRLSHGNKEILRSQTRSG
jgi:hypothetical protein